MRNDFLQDSLKLALRFAEIAKQQEHPHEEAAIMKTLPERLHRVAGVPTAVAAGRAGLRYKLRAMLHSMRLTSPTWAAVARLANSAFPSTGDLGTESG